MSVITGAVAHTEHLEMRSCASRLRVISEGLPETDATAVRELGEIADAIDRWARSVEGPSPDYFLG